ncbi:hypothetical protein [Cryobacterium melibiosiphilum]|uniref:hypothetical protein n=1 Tax=Cryobacterium melibiosiphilum TaxID=995039 RepID=UPI0018F551E2|nr:hypothetical protein [Cryobacterium melibiosiphilum]
MTALDNTTPPLPDEPIGGDPVCWLERVCPDCGALVEAELPAECWRCGATVSPS